MIPTRDAWEAYSNNGTTTPVIDISGAAVGDWQIIAAQIGTTGRTFTTPSGWTELMTPNYSMGSRQISLYGRIKVSGDSNPSLVKSGSTNCAWTYQRGKGAQSIANWILGTRWARNGLAAQQFITVGQSVTSLKRDCLALNFAYEATNGADTTDAVVSGAGWSKWGQRRDDGTIIEQLRTDYKDMPFAGATGDVTDTWPVLQLTNGAAMQILIPSPKARNAFMGSTAPDAIKFGSADVDAVYSGSTLVWEK